MPYMTTVKIGAIFPIMGHQEKKIRLLAQRDGMKCVYCGQPLSHFYKKCVAHERHDDFWNDGSGDNEPGLYPVYSSFLPDGCEYFHIDHKVPRAKGGKNTLDNLVLACVKCNQEKSDRYTYEEFLALKRGTV